MLLQEILFSTSGAGLVQHTVSVANRSQVRPLICSFALLFFSFPPQKVTMFMVCAQTAMMLVMEVRKAVAEIPLMIHLPLVPFIAYLMLGTFGFITGLTAHPV